MMATSCADVERPVKKNSGMKWIPTEGYDAHNYVDVLSILESQGHCAWGEPQ